MPAVTRIIPMPLTQAGLDPTLAINFAGLQDALIESGEEVEDFSGELMKGKGWGKGKGGDSQALGFRSKLYSGISGGGLWDGESDLPVSTFSELWDIYARVYTYADSIEWTWLSKKFDVYNLNAKKAKEFGKNMADLFQNITHAFFVNVFTSTWFDGVPFASASHPYAPNAQGVGTSNTWSNLLTGSPTYDNIQSACVMLETARDAMRRPIRGQRAFRVVCNDSVVESVNEELNINMGFAPHTANNDVNMLDKRKLTVFGDPYIPSPMWYVEATTSRTYRNVMDPITMMELILTKTYSHFQGANFTVGTWSETPQAYVFSQG